MSKSTVIATFQGYFLELRPTSPLYVLRDRAGGPVVQGDTRGDIFAEAIDALDDFHDTGHRGAFSTADFEAMERMIVFLADQQTKSRTLVTTEQERAA